MFRIGIFLGGGNVAVCIFKDMFAYLKQETNCNTLVCNFAILCYCVVYCIVAVEAIMTS